MLDILQSYLNDNATPEARDMLVAAHKTFEDLQIEGYETSFEELLMTDDVADQNDTITKVSMMTNAVQFGILAEHAVGVDVDTPIDICDKIIRALIDIQTYQDTESVVRMTLIDGHENEVLAEILALVSSLSVEEMLTYLDTVNAETITMIREMATAKESEQISEEEHELLKAHQKALAKFIHFNKSDKVKTIAAIRKGVPIGLPFLVYLNIIGRDLEEMKPIDAAKELVVMSLAASDGLYTPRQVIKENIDRVVSDLDTITAIDIAVNDLLIGYDRYEEA